LQRTHADLLSDPGQARAARFFLDELYGPQDFEARDAQFARIVPALTRLFSEDLLRTVRDLAQLHALSESLDTAMGEALGQHAAALDERGYRAAWQTTGRRADRELQIQLLGSIGRSLARLTRRPLVRQSLRVMRAPARAAGLGALQRFLESGFETFRNLSDPQRFIQTIESRESGLASDLFDGEGPPE
jgi:hypothetical protein